MNPNKKRQRVLVAVVTAGAWAAETLGAGVSAAQEWPSFIDHSRGDTGIYGLRTPAEGVKAARHMDGTVTTGDSRDFQVDDAHTAAIVSYVEQWLPGLVSRPITTTTCLYTTTPTQDFVLDRQGPIVVGSPCSGHGFKFTPLIGRMLADLAEGKSWPGGRFSLR